MKSDKQFIDEDLFQSLRNNDRKAFEILFHKYYAQLCRKVNSIIQDEESAEDVVQQLFIKIWESRENITQPDSVIAYLTTSARNRALNHLKAANRKSSNETPLTHATDPEDNRTEEQMDAKELQKAINEAIQLLPEKRREVFLLSRQEGKSYKEIAAIMDISIKTVEAQMGKALSTLREFVANYQGSSLIICLFSIIFNL